MTENILRKIYQDCRERRKNGMSYGVDLEIGTAVQLKY